MVSNVAFIAYALIDGLTPILILHSALLPLNLLRLLQIRELTAEVEKAATEEFSALLDPSLHEKKGRPGRRNPFCRERSGR